MAARDGRIDRNKIWLRRVGMRRLQCARRWNARPRVRRLCPRRRRTVRDHSRGTEAGRRAPSRPAGLPRYRRHAVRFLHARHGRGRRRAARCEPAAQRRRDRALDGPERMPVLHVSAHSGRDSSSARPPRLRAGRRGFGRARTVIRASPDDAVGPRGTRPARLLRRARRRRDLCRSSGLGRAGNVGADRRRMAARRRSRHGHRVHRQGGSRSGDAACPAPHCRRGDGDGPRQRSPRGRRHRPVSLGHRNLREHVDADRGERPAACRSSGPRRSGARPRAGTRRQTHDDCRARRPAHARGRLAPGGT